MPLLLGMNAASQPRRDQASAEQSFQVQVKALEIVRAMRRIESSVFWTVLGRPQGLEPFDFSSAGAAVLESISELRRMTQDNDSQQNRVKALQALVVAELSALDRARISTPEVARGLLDSSDPILERKPLVDEIIAEEQKLLRDRRARSARGERLRETIAIGSAITQALLLVFVLLLAERANRDSLRAAASTEVERARARKIVEGVPTALALLAPDLSIVEANPAFRGLYGVAEAELGGRKLGDISGGGWDDPGLLQRLSDVAQLDREIWDLDLKQNDSEGRQRNMLLNARRLGDGQQDMVLMTAVDVTARLRSEEQVHDLNRQLTGKIEQVSEVNRELEAFSYSVSHDLRAPLRHIAAFAGKLDLELGEGASDKSRHYLRVIEESSQRMSQLIDDLLVYSRLGRGALRVLPIDMQSVVADVRAMLSSDEASGKVQWDIGNLPVVEADDNMLRLVWQNLLGNAIKYSGTQSAPRIRVRAELDRAMQEWVFSVADNGVGFDMAYVDKLFGVFQRLHKASDFPGTGIGLANVRRIVTRHHGRVWAEGAIGEGATFCFTLPVTTR